MAVDITPILDAVYDEALGKGNLDALDAVFDAAYTDHGPFGDATGLDAFKAMVAQWREAFPDVRYTYSDVIQDGDRAAWRSTMTGTHLGDLPGIPATGRRVDLQAIDMGTSRDGRAFEHWTAMDRLALLEQLGVLPTGAGTPG